MKTYSVVILECGNVKPTVIEGISARTAWSIVNSLAEVVYSDKAYHNYEVGYRIFNRHHDTMCLTNKVGNSVSFSVTDNECTCLRDGYILEEGTPMPKTCRYYDPSVGTYVSGDIVEAAIAFNNIRQAERKVILA